MQLSIIIINYNTFQLTCNCIRSIRETTGIEHEIILVDNNSREFFAEKFLDVFPDIKLVRLNENIGFGRANNRGVQEAKGKYVLLLNSDTPVHTGTLDETVGYLEANPEIDILGCKVLLDNNTPQSTVIKYEGEENFLSALKYLVKRNTFFVETRIRAANARQKKNEVKAPNISELGEEKGAALSPNYHDGKRIGLITGVFLSLKRSVYEESKGFDPDFFMYYEETEWFRNRLRKYNILYYPYATITHFHGSSDVYKKMNRQFFVSSFLFWYKMGYAQFFVYFLYTLLEVPSRLLVRWVYNRPRPGRDVLDIVGSLPYAFKILRYSNRYGARKRMLKLNYLNKNNL